MSWEIWSCVGAASSVPILKTLDIFFRVILTEMTYSPRLVMKYSRSKCKAHRSQHENQNLSYDQHEFSKSLRLVTGFAGKHVLSWNSHLPIIEIWIRQFVFQLIHSSESQIQASTSPKPDQLVRKSKTAYSSKDEISRYHRPCQLDWWLNFCGPNIKLSYQNLMKTCLGIAIPRV